jgi:uncharacterized protein DUF4145
VDIDAGARWSREMSDEKIEIYCNQCKGTTLHEALCHASKTFEADANTESDVYFADYTWEVLLCRGCQAATFRETVITNENYYLNRTVAPTIHLFPPRNEHNLAVNPDLFAYIPDNLFVIYREIIGSYNMGYYILCAMGLRALIEGMCADKGIKNGPVVRDNGKIERLSNLQGKIEGMTEKEFLTKGHSKTLHELRFLGNDAAHELDSPTFEELEIAIVIVEHTLENIYGLDRKAAELRWKKESRKQ